MTDINAIWTNLNKGLNSITLIQNKCVKANSPGNLPSSYPYVTTNVTTSYLQDKDDIRGTLTRENVTGDNTKVKIKRTETPKMIFSLSCYSDSTSECLTILETIKDWLVFSGQQYLSSCGIVVLGCSNIVNKSSWLEVEYQYIYGFDLTVRVENIAYKTTDAVNSVEATNLLNNEKINV